MFTVSSLSKPMRRATPSNRPSCLYSSGSSQSSTSEKSFIALINSDLRHGSSSETSKRLVSGDLFASHFRRRCDKTVASKGEPDRGVNVTIFPGVDNCVEPTLALSVTFRVHRVRIEEGTAKRRDSMNGAAILCRQKDASTIRPTRWNKGRDAKHFTVTHRQRARRSQKILFRPGHEILLRSHVLMDARQIVGDQVSRQVVTRPRTLGTIALRAFETELCARSLHDGQGLFVHGDVEIERRISNRSRQATAAPGGCSHTIARRRTDRVPSRI